MRLLIENIITEKEAEYLLSLAFNRSIVIWDNPTVNKALERILKALPQQNLIKKKSYWRIERHSGKGHPWHYDGCIEEGGELKPNHMAWCNYSASILLAKPEGFEGGTFVFDNPREEYKASHYLSAVVYSSGANNDPQLHKVEPYTGDRAALLCFLETV